MAQKSQVIDVTRSYLPGDPNAFAMNLVSTQREDGEEKPSPVVPFEGHNFLPTSYGYKSYFGLNSELTMEALPKPCDNIILFQNLAYQNLLIALCSDGIRTATSVATTWTLLAGTGLTFTGDFTVDQVYRPWTYVVIENDLYIYRQGHTHVVKIDSTGNAVSVFIPSFLNMSGQMGIFKANGRLGFWDSANSVSWSSAFDLTDFTPALETMVGNTILLGVRGRIITIKSHGEGFIIYCTGSILGVSYTTTGTTLWDAKVLTPIGGISYPKAVTNGSSDTEHFVFSSIGIFTVGKFNPIAGQFEIAPIATELYDYFKEDRTPVYLDCLLGRYLFFSTQPANYVYGITTFTEVVLDSRLTSFDLINDLPEAVDGDSMITILNQILDQNNKELVDLIIKENAIWYPRYTIVTSSLPADPAPIVNLTDENFIVLTGDEFEALIAVSGTLIDGYEKFGTPITITSARKAQNTLNYIPGGNYAC